MKSVPEKDFTIGGEFIVSAFVISGPHCTVRKHNTDLIYSGPGAASSLNPN